MVELGAGRLMLCLSAGVEHVEGVGDAASRGVFFRAACPLLRCPSRGSWSRHVRAFSTSAAICTNSTVGRTP